MLSLIEWDFLYPQAYVIIKTVNTTELPPPVIIIIIIIIIKRRSGINPIPPTVIDRD